MRFQIEYIRQFFRDSRGAISVDYVVLAAAVTAVTLASTDIIQAGMRSLSGTVSSELKGDSPSNPTSVTYSNGFDNGAQGWQGTGGSNIDGIGHVLGPIGGSDGTESISRDFTFAPGTASATFEFDLYALDSLDNESGIIFIDGREIGRVTSNMGRATFTVAAGLDPNDYNVQQFTVTDNEHFGGSDRWRDHHSMFQITVRDPGENVTFGFGSTANQHVGDESFALDNFTVSSTAGSSSSTTPSG